MIHAQAVFRYSGVIDHKVAVLCRELKFHPFAFWKLITHDFVFLLFLRDLFY